MNYPKKIELTFATLTLYPQMVISAIHEEVILNNTHINEFRKIYMEHYQGIPFIYIAHRKNSYTVDPLIYKQLAEVETLKGIALVSHETKNLKSAIFEEYFSPVPLEIFENLEEAKTWGHRILT